jgi:hypothetical protein
LITLELSFQSLTPRLAIIHVILDNQSTSYDTLKKLSHENVGYIQHDGTAYQLLVANHATPVAYANPEAAYLSEIPSFFVTSFRCNPMKIFDF